jgi:hypothetical protein
MAMFTALSFGLAGLEGCRCGCETYLGLANHP